MPEIKTRPSQAAAGRDQAELIRVTNDIASKPELLGIIADGNNVPGITNSGANCFVGVEFERFNVGVVEEFRFFMDYFGNKELYVGNLVFQGSNDGFDLDINDLLVVGEELHEGWNYYDLDKPDFASYRLFNAENNGCNSIGELKLFGQKVYSADFDPITCFTDIYIYETDQFAEITQDLSYDLALTAYVN